MRLNQVPFVNFTHDFKLGYATCRFPHDIFLQCLRVGTGIRAHKCFEKKRTDPTILGSQVVVTTTTPPVLYKLQAKGHPSSVSSSSGWFVPLNV